MNIDQIAVIITIRLYINICMTQGGERKNMSPINSGKTLCFPPAYHTFIRWEHRRNSLHD
jgi:hypothetical protein